MTIKMQMKTDEGHEFTIERVVDENTLRRAWTPGEVVHAELSAVYKEFEAVLLRWAGTYTNKA